MSLVPHKNDPNRKDQLKKMKETQKRLKRGQSPDKGNDYKEGPDQERLIELKKEAEKKAKEEEEKKAKENE